MGHGGLCPCQAQERGLSRSLRGVLAASASSLRYVQFFARSLDRANVGTSHTGLRNWHGNDRVIRRADRKSSTAILSYGRILARRECRDGECPLVHARRGARRSPGLRKPSATPGPRRGNESPRGLSFAGRREGARMHRHRLRGRHLARRRSNRQRAPDWRVGRARAHPHAHRRGRSHCGTPRKILLRANRARHSLVRAAWSRVKVHHRLLPPHGRPPSDGPVW